MYRRHRRGLHLAVCILAALSPWRAARERGCSPRDNAETPPLTPAQVAGVTQGRDPYLDQRLDGAQPISQMRGPTTRDRLGFHGPFRDDRIRPRKQNTTSHE
jgi:hypothetical protein